MRRIRGQVNVPIAVASLAISVLLFFIVLPNWMSRRLRPITVPLTTWHLDNKKFFIQKEPKTMKVYAYLSDKDYDDVSGIGSAEADMTDARAGNNSYPVSLYPPKLRKIVQDQDLHAAYTLEVVKSRDVEVDVVETGKMSDPTLVLVDVKPDSQRVSVEGPEDEVLRVVKARATLKLDTLTKNSSEVFGLLEPVDKDGRVIDRVDVHPTQVRVTPKFTLAPEQKQVFVQAVFDDKKLPPGYVVKNYFTDPQSVTATGSSQALARVSSVRTEKIDLSRLTGSQTIIVQLHPLGGGIVLSPSSVGVTINVETAGINRLNLKPSSNRPGAQFPFVPGVPR